MHARWLVVFTMALSGCPSADDATDDGSPAESDDTGGSDRGDGDDGGTGGDDADASDGADDDSDGDGSDTGGPDPAEPFTSGERLRAVVYEADDGTPAWRYWHDQELEIDCYFSPVAEGGYRCLPTDTRAIYYADDACQDEAMRTHCTEPGGHVRITEDFGCNGSSEWTAGLRRVGEPVTALWGRSSDGRCYPLAEGTTGYRLEPADAEAFVAATATTVPHGALSRFEVEADDGATQWFGPYLDGGASSCEVLTVDGDERCVSWNRAWPAYYVHDDASCATASVVQYTITDGCPAPEVSVLPDRSVVSLGSNLGENELFFGGGTSCEAFTPVQDTGYVSINDAAPGGMVAAEIRLVGEGRLQRRMVADPGGDVVSVAYPRFFDTELDIACEPTATVDGGLACAPTSTLHATHFADETCTQPLYRAFAGWAPPSGYVAMRPLVEQCEASAVSEIRSIGPEFAGPVFRDNGGRCVPEATPPTLDRFFSLDDPIATSALAEVNETTQ